MTILRESGTSESLPAILGGPTSSVTMVPEPDRRHVSERPRMGTGSESPASSDGLTATVLRHRRVFAICVVVGLAVGLVIGAVVPVKYTAQARLIAGATSVTAAAVPSYAQAGISLAETYSRVFDSDAVQKVLHSRFGDGKLDIKASPIADSSVVLIEATAADPATATQLADTGVDALVQVVTGLLDNDRNVRQATASLNDVYTQLNTAQATLSRLQRERVPANDPGLIKAQADVQTAQTAVSAYATQLSTEVGNTAASNGIQRLASGYITSDTGVQRFELYGVIGLFLGIGAGVVLAYVADARPATTTSSTGRLRRPLRRRKSAARLPVADPMDNPATEVVDEPAHDPTEDPVPESDGRGDEERAPFGVDDYSTRSPLAPADEGVYRPRPRPWPRAENSIETREDTGSGDTPARTPGGRR